MGASRVSADRRAFAQTTLSEKLAKNSGSQGLCVSKRRRPITFCAALHCEIWRTHALSAIRAGSTPLSCRSASLYWRCVKRRLSRARLFQACAGPAACRFEFRARMAELSAPPAEFEARRSCLRSRKAELFAARVPSFELEVPSSDLGVPSCLLRASNYELGVPSFELGEPSRLLRAPSSDLGVPSFERGVPSCLLRVPSSELGDSSFELG